MHRAPKTLITGNGAIAKIGEEAKKLRATKVLIITDPGVACTGSVSQIEDPLHAAGLKTGLFDKAVPEPPMGSVDAIVKFAEKGKYDCIVGFGGGSAIDVAKMVAVLVGSGAKVEDYVGVDQVPKRPADHRRADDGRHRLRGHRHRHLRQREAQREAGRRQRLPHPQHRASSTRSSRGAARRTSPPPPAWTP